MCLAAMPQGCKNASRAKQAQLAAEAKQAEAAAAPMQQLQAQMPLDPNTHNPMFSAMVAQQDPGGHFPAPSVGGLKRTDCLIDCLFLADVLPQGLVRLGQLHCSVADKGVPLCRRGGGGGVARHRAGHAAGAVGPERRGGGAAGAGAAAAGGTGAGGAQELPAVPGRPLHQPVPRRRR